MNAASARPAAAAGVRASASMRREKARIGPSTWFRQFAYSDHGSSFAFGSIFAQAELDSGGKGIAGFLA